LEDGIANGTHEEECAPAQTMLDPKIKGQENQDRAAAKTHEEKNGDEKMRT
jgi:hypothetical protein